MQVRCQTSARVMETSRLRMGKRLNFGDSLVSENGQHVLRFEEDGNLVLYRNGRVEWHTNTVNRPLSSGSAYAEMEADGNFVVAHKWWGYRWESLSKNYNARKPYLVVENDGIISLYDEEVDGRHWSSDDFPDEIKGLFEEYTLAKRFLEKFQTNDTRAKAANAKFQALRQWLEVLRATRGVSIKTLMNRARWTQDHARDIGLISVVNRMQKIRDRIDAEINAIKLICRLSPYRLKHLQYQKNGGYRESNDKRQMNKVIRGLIKERERRRVEQRKMWLTRGTENPSGGKFGFEHDDEFDDGSCNGGSDYFEKAERAEKVPERFKHSIDFLLLTIHEVVEFESLTATAECNRAQAWLFHLYIKGDYEPHYTAFDVDEIDSVNMWERSSLKYWKFVDQGSPAIATYGLSEDENWFGKYTRRLASITE